MKTIQILNGVATVSEMSEQEIYDFLETHDVFPIQTWDNNDTIISHNERLYDKGVIVGTTDDGNFCDIHSDESELLSLFNQLESVIC